MAPFFSFFIYILFPKREHDLEGNNAFIVVDK